MTATPETVRAPTRRAHRRIGRLAATRRVRYEAGMSRVVLCAFLLIAAQIIVAPGASATVEDADPFALGAAADTLDTGILGPEDAARYRRIFELQEDGDWKAADREVARLDDRLLMGHVLYQRYMHPTKYRSGFKELSAWMKRYADHPGARRVYRLARKRQPARARAPERPVRPNGHAAAENGTADTGEYLSPRRRSAAARREARRLQAHIRSHIRGGRLASAVKHLKSRAYRDLLDETEIAILQAGVVGGYFRRGRDESAVALAAESAGRARTHEPTVDKHAGLAAWRLGRRTDAAVHFGALAESRTASEREIAFGAFWAARAHLATGDPARAARYLHIAAGHPRTFYGQLARRLVGERGPLPWDAPVLLPSDYDRLKDSAYVRRAVALRQTGRLYWAERELRAAFVEAPDDTRKAMLALAVRLGLPGAALHLARTILTSDGDAYDRALFPVPPWKPESGFKVDRAVLFALMRQESGFNSRAQSGAGARGLMQLMPRTAGFIARDRSLRGRNKRKLFAPEYNIHLGQKYLLHLMTEHEFLDNLVLVVAAYNGGPGNLRKWQRRIGKSDDPLMFIESLPSRETREFVRRVFTNIWIYRALLEQPAPSLDALAAGRWPVYRSLDSRIETAAGDRETNDVRWD